MKQTRRRHHLRPRPCRAQINQQVEHVRSQMQLFQLEGMIEARKSEPNLPRLRFLDHMLALMGDEVASLESL